MSASQEKRPSSIEEYLNRMALDAVEIQKRLLDAPADLTGAAEPALYTIVNKIWEQLDEAKKIWKC